LSLETVLRGLLVGSGGVGSAAFERFSLVLLLYRWREGVYVRVMQKGEGEGRGIGDGSTRRYVGRKVSFHSEWEKLMSTTYVFLLLVHDLQSLVLPSSTLLVDVLLKARWKGTHGRRKNEEVWARVAGKTGKWTSLT
jgi:hypothetical protein